MAEEAGEELAGLNLAGSEGASAQSPDEAPSNHPPTIIVIGMAGSGKTALVRRLQSHLATRSLPGYIINLDPAAINMPYEPNVDIQDTVNYKNVMKEYALGPNGAILTSLNLFATRFDQVLDLLGKKRDPPLRYAVLDTPGQIEIFTWSASGAIITEAAAATAPCVLLYVVDTPRATAPATFMSNMLQACSILYRTRLPLVLAFNKVDVARHDFALGWMEDYEVFQSALDSDTTYAATLSRSLSLVLERFYESLDAIGVSAHTGEGFDELLEACDRGFDEYRKDYLPDLRRKQRARDELEARRRAANMSEYASDRAATEGAARSGPSGGAAGAAVRADEDVRGPVERTLGSVREELEEDA